MVEKDERYEIFLEDDWIVGSSETEINTKKNPSGRRKRSRTILLRLVVLALIIVLFAGLYNRLIKKESFPLPDNGRYIGTLSFFGTSKSIPLFFERYGDKIYAALLDSDWEAVNTSASDVAVNTLVLKSSQTVASLVGKSESSDRYTGLVRGTANESLGKWKLSRVGDSGTGPPPSVLLALKLELDDLNRRLAEAGSRIPKQQKDIEKYLNIFDSKDGVKENADKKFDDEKSRLTQLREVLSAKRDELKRSQAKLVLAYRVTEAGELVKLSRDTLEKYKEIVESSLVKEKVPETEAFKVALDRAYRIRSLMEEITKEERLIDDLRGIGRYSIE